MRTISRAFVQVLFFLFLSLILVSISGKLFAGVEEKAPPRPDATRSIAKTALRLQSSQPGFGSVPLGTATTQVVTFQFTVATTLSSVNILISGASGLDYTDAGASTCGANTAYAAGDSCIVNVSFSPTAPGMRAGAVTLFAQGNTLPLMTSYLNGIGQSSAVTVDPGTQTNIGTISSGAAYGSTVDGAGNVYVVDRVGGQVTEFVFATNGFTPNVVLTGLNGPTAVAVDGAGNLYVSDTQNNQVVMVPNENGTLNSGDKSVVSISGLGAPHGLAVDGNGNLYVADATNLEVVEVPAGGGTPVAVAQVSTATHGLAVDAGGNVYVATNEAVTEYPFGGATPVPLGSGFSNPRGLAVDAAGNVYVADTGNARIVELAAGGSSQSNFAITGLTAPQSVSLDSASNLYVTDGGNVYEVNRTQAVALTFPATNVGSTSTSQTLTVSNSGNLPLAMSSVAVSANFLQGISGGTDCGSNTNLPSGGQCLIAVAFAPMQSGILPGLLTVTDNALNNPASTQSVQLSGSAMQMAQTITFTTGAPASATYNTSFMVAAAASSGLPVAYTSSGSCTNSGATYTVTSGTGTCTVMTDQPGNGQYLPAPQATQTVSASPASQTISFTINAPATAVYNSAFSVAATATSSLPVVYTSSGACTNSGATYTMASGTGTCSVIANQAGNGNYLAAPQVTQSTVAALASSSISLSSLVTSIYTNQSATLTATVSGLGSGGPPSVTVSFMLGSTTLGMGVLVPNGSNSSASSVPLNGSQLAPGANIIYAVYSGDSDYPTATSANITMTLQSSQSAFGSVPVGTAATPQSLTYQFTGPTTLSAINILAAGVPGLDYTDAGASTCAANIAYTAGSSCTVNVAFTPSAPGIRAGGVTLFATGSALPLMTWYLSGIGQSGLVTVDPGTQSTIGTISSGAAYGSAVDLAGNVYVVDHAGGQVIELAAGTFTPSTVLTGLNGPTAIAVDGAGNLYVSDTQNNQVLMVPNENGTLNAGDKSVVSIPSLGAPHGIAVDGGGNLYVADAANGDVIEVPSGGGTLVTIAQGLVAPQGVAVDANGNLYITSNNALTEYPSGGGTAIPLGTGYNNPSGLAVDAAGNVYVADTGNARIAEVSSGGASQSNFAIASLKAPQSVSLDAAGNLYVTDGNNVYEVNRTQPAPLAFPATNVGSTTPSQPLTVSNGGNANVSISGISIAGTNQADFGQANTCAAVLASNARCNVGVTFSPTATGPRSASLTISNHGPGGVHSTSLMGNGTAPAISLSPSTLAFGSQDVGFSSTTQTVTLTNTGTGPLIISNIAATANYTQSNTCGTFPASLASNSGCTIQIAFSPSSAGSSPGSLSISDNAASSPQTVKLSGTGVAPTVSLTPASLAFGNQFLGTTSSAQKVTLKNTGTVSLLVKNIALTGTNPTNFAETATCAGTLAPSTSCTINVTFTPLAIGSRTASLTVTDNAGNGTQSVSLTGSGMAPVTLSPSSVTFASQPLGATSAPTSITLQNPGSSLTISSIGFTGANSGDFSETSTCGSTLATGASCKITVTFSPLATGTRTASLSVTDSASNSPQSATLIGTGIAPVTLTASGLTFPNQVVATASAVQPVTLKNYLTTRLTISGISVTGDYSETNTCGTGLAAGGSCVINVTFIPTVAGARNGTLAISDNAVGSPQIVVLTGTGVPVPAPQFCPNATYATPYINGTLMNMVVSATIQTGFPQTVSGTAVPLSLVFEESGPSATGGLQSVSHISLYYTVDDIPVGPLLSSSPFAYKLDSTQYADGEHLLSVRYAAQPAWPSSSCQTYAKQEFPFVVANHAVVTGPQFLPTASRANNPVSSAILPPAIDRVYYPGSKPHPATSNPYPYAFVPPAGGVAPSGFFVEPLNHVGSDFGQGNPSFYQLENGAPVVENFYPEAGSNIEQIYLSTEYEDFHDGPRNDNDADPYSNCVPNLDGPGFYCIGLEGRLYKINMDGSLQTLAGLVTVSLPIYYPDWKPSIPTKVQTFIGTYDSQFEAPVDLTIDPRNHKIFYVADTENNRIAKVDTSGATPVISTYAGYCPKFPCTAGYLDGPALSAKFNEPYSLVMAANGTMYVADRTNFAIRTISSDGSTVSTLVRNAHEPSLATVAAAPLTYAPRSAVPFSSAYINYPFALRLTSTGNLVETEPASMCIRLINLTAQTITTIAQIRSTGDPLQSWIWLDVDSRGSIGPVDGVVATKSLCDGAACAYKFPITGDTNVPPATFPNGACPSTQGTLTYFGYAGCVQNPYGHYSWEVAISATEGRVIFMGYGALGIFSFHISQPSDPPWSFSTTNYTSGENIWRNGSVVGFPWGSRPGFTAVHGYEVFSRLGNVKNADDMNALPDESPSALCSAVATPGTLQAYLLSGAEGSVPRPEITGNDLRDLTYFVRKNALGNISSQPLASCTGNTPVITSVAVTPSTGGLATVTWVTDQPTFGLVQWGTVSGEYFGSQFENSSTQYTTTHTAQLSQLPSGATVYFSVRAKNVAGGAAGQNTSQEMVFTAQ